MRLLFATSEAHPLAKSGGLADVSRALPIVLRQQGVDARLVLPGYSCAIIRLIDPKIETRLPASLGAEDACLISGLLPESEVPVWVIHAPSLYSRPGGLYQDATSRDWADNPRRFAYFARVTVGLAMGYLSPWKADIVHANDWHAGLVPFFLALAGKPRPATVFTVHNLAFQGNFPRSALEETGVADRFFVPDGVEFYGRLSFLKAGLCFSDKITTVSEQYCREVMTAEQGCGLEGVLQARRRDFSGILNGIEDDIWNPATDPLLPRCYSVHDISGKRICKAALQQSLGLQPVPDMPLIGFSSRLTQQKMADIVVEAIPGILAQGAQLVVLGDGERELQTALSMLERHYHGQLVYRSYSEDMAHQLQAGADILLAPARYEPCGLTQLYALRYGTVPVVRRTGGLADTVTDAQSVTMTAETATGFVFEEATKEAFEGAVQRALRLFREPLAWRRLQLAGMKRDSGWKTSAAKYIALYEELSGLSLSGGTLYAPEESWEPWQREIRSAQRWA
jgi:starch synthase